VPSALELPAEQFEAQVALCQLGLRVAFGRPHAVVELRNVPAAVVALRDLALEAGVIHRMVFDLDGHPLDVGIVRGTLRHRPALQRVADLQPEIVMPTAGMVQLHHEQRALALRQPLARLRLAGFRELPLAAVLGQAHCGCSVIRSLCLPRRQCRVHGAAIHGRCDGADRRCNTQRENRDAPASREDFDSWARQDSNSSGRPLIPEGTSPRRYPVRASDDTLSIFKQRSADSEIESTSILTIGCSTPSCFIPTATTAARSAIDLPTSIMISLVYSPGKPISLP